MLLSNRILLSVTYMILVLSGVSIPEELKKWIQPKRLDKKSL